MFVPDRKPLLTVIIPVFNEARTLHDVLEKVRSVPVEKEIILVDDCSADGLREIVGEEVARGAVALFQPTNRGKGAAIRRGLLHATGEYVIVQDADLEYNPQDILRLLEPALTGEANVVYGSRFMGDLCGMSVSNRVANTFLTLFTNLFYGSSLSDMETCYKLWKREVIQSIPLRSDRFDFEVEVTAKVLKRKIPIREVPISYSGRRFSEGKKIGWKDGFSALWAIILYRFRD